jgi:tetratricopeptide (TPR) repeat protein/tRNA A-37 threonylcarbamoyl transferase component Bud32
MAVQWVGPYRILETLGKGAMGEVYLAKDPRLDRKVALKRLSDPDLNSPESRRRLMREARAAARLNHPNVASVYDVVPSDHGVHIVMEYVAGETLAARLRSGRMAPPTAVSIGIQLAEALTDAHAMGVIHRDLKPGNVIVSPGDRVKILDFGLAQILDVAGAGSASSAPPSPTGDGGSRVAGTPPYMAPETFEGRSQDARTDIYSLGVTLFEMLTGRRPYKGEDLKSLEEAVRSGPAPRIRDLDPSLPASLDAIVARSMARNVEDRYGSAAELADALRGELVDAPTLPGRSPRALETVPGGRRGAAIVAVIALLAAIGPLIPKRNPPPAAPGSAVVAVLPLMNTTGDPANDRLGIGIADVLTSTLARVPGVTMISRSATFSYQKPDRDVRSIARELGADLIVDGVVQASHDTVRVTVNLLRPRTNVVAWSHAYDGAFSEIFALQTEAASALSEALQVTLTPEDKRRLQSPATTNLEALAEYAQARSFLERPDVPENLERSITLFESAIGKDPRFARAHAGLSQAYGLRFQRTRDGVWADKSLLEVTQALRLDPNDSATHQALAVAYAAKGRTEEALEELRRAISLQPANDEAHNLLGKMLFDTGRRDEGIAELKQAISLRPNYWGNYYTLGVVYFDAGRFSEASSAFRRVLDLQPDSSRGLYMLGTVQLVAGDTGQAIETLRRAIAARAGHGAYTNLGQALYLERRYADAATAFEKAALLAPKSPMKQRNLGDVYERLGQAQRAKEAYRRAVELCTEELKTNPRDARTLSMLAVYEAKLGDHSAAARHASEALAISPGMADVIYRRAVVLALEGSMDESLTALEHALTSGYSAKLARADDDLARLRPRPEFERLTGDRAIAEDGGTK